jgi:D-glycero-D-manno-heptose 1,7-bisphosphate phosphatase
MSRRLVILDRDGVLNVDLPQSVTRLEDFEIIEGAPEAVANLNRAGFTVALATNQACVGRGDMTPRELQRVHAALRSAVADAGGRIDAIYVCPEKAEDANDRRKPGAGMLREALADFDAVAGDVWFVGDSLGDLKAARDVGCRPALVRTGKGMSVLEKGLSADLGTVAVYENIAAFAESISGAV